MKRILIFLGLIISLGLNAQRVYVDSLDFALLVGTDTVLYPDLGKFNSGGMLSVEIVYTTLNNDSAWVQIGGSNKGNTFNNGTMLYGASTDSVQLDTLTQRIVYGAASNVDAVATAQSSVMFVGDRHWWKYLGLRFIKGDVTAGKAYYYIVKL